MNYFLCKSVLCNWCSKGYCVCCPVCGIMHIKDPLLLIIKWWQWGFSLAKWFFTIYHITVIGVLANFDKLIK